MTGALPGHAMMRELLEWPMGNAGNRESFEHLGTKGGSLRGVLTASYFAQKPHRPPRVLSLFLSKVPTDSWRALTRNFAQQGFELALLQDGAFEERVRERLTLPAAGHAAAPW